MTEGSLHYNQAERDANNTKPDVFAQSDMVERRRIWGMVWGGLVALALCSGMGYVFIEAAGKLP